MTLSRTDRANVSAIRESVPSAIRAPATAAIRASVLCTRYPGSPRLTRRLQLRDDPVRVTAALREAVRHTLGERSRPLQADALAADQDAHQVGHQGCLTGGP